MPCRRSHGLGACRQRPRRAGRGSAGGDGRQVRRSRRCLQIAERGAVSRRAAHAYAREDPLHRIRNRRKPGPAGVAGCGRDPGTGRLRRAWHRGQDRGGEARPRKPYSLSRHLPRHAGRRNRLRAERLRSGRCPQHGILSQYAAPGHRAGHRMARRDRPHRATQPGLESRRHDASRRADLPARRWQQVARAVQRRADQRTPSSSLRVQQQLSRCPDP